MKNILSWIQNRLLAFLTWMEKWVLLENTNDVGTHASLYLQQAHDKCLICLTKPESRHKFALYSGWNLRGYYRQSVYKSEIRTCHPPSISMCSPNRKIISASGTRVLMESYWHRFEHDPVTNNVTLEWGDGLKAEFTPLLTPRFWASYLIPLTLSFLICKEKITIPTLKYSSKNKIESPIFIDSTWTENVLSKKVQLLLVPIVIQCNIAYTNYLL